MKPIKRKSKPPRMKTRKKSGGMLSTIIIGLIFAIGLGIMLYPTVSDWWNSMHQSRAIQSYADTVSEMSEQDYDAIFSVAEEYNNRRRAAGAAMLKDPLDGYEQTLTIDGTNVIGYVEIPKINVKLPVYHGTNERELQAGCGHLDGSSLPIGGESNHAVLSTHRGLPTAKLFSDLDQLEEGDTFTITVLNRVLTYEVDQIRIVLPTQMQDMSIVEGMDYCTLMTCTPYGINTHRLLVRGHRIETQNLIHLEQDASKVNPLLVAIAVGLPILLIVLVILIWRTGRKPPAYTVPQASTASEEPDESDEPMDDIPLDPHEFDEPEAPSDWEELE